MPTRPATEADPVPDAAAARSTSTFPNLTRDLRPYAVIENVILREGRRGFDGDAKQGYVVRW